MTKRQQVRDTKEKGRERTREREREREGGGRNRQTVRQSEKCQY